MNVQGHYKNHRTVCVIDFTGADDEFIERAKRFKQSVNGPNIKVDFVSIHDGKAVSGFVPNSPSQASPQGDDEIREWASELGYTQVLINRPG